MAKRKPVRTKRRRKAQMAFLKARRTPEELTWEDMQIIRQEISRPQPPSPPLRERVQSIDVGLRPEQAQIFAREKRTKWRKFKDIFNKSKGAAQTGGRKAMTTGKRVIRYGQDYTKRLDEEAQRQLAEIEKEYPSYSSRAPVETEDDTQYIELDEPDVNEDIEEPYVDEGAMEPDVEGYTRRKKRRKKKKIKKRKKPKKRTKRRKRRR